LVKKRWIQRSRVLSEVKLLGAESADDFILKDYQEQEIEATACTIIRMKRLARFWFI